MRTLQLQETTAVGGGDEAAVDASIGNMIGHAIHGLTSDEAAVCGSLSPAGIFVGAILHFVNKH